MRIEPPTPENIARAAAALQRGDVVAYPTETVYGLGVDPRNEAALERLFAVKRRDPAHAVLLIVNGMEQLAGIVREVSPRARAYAGAFWPGPLSMLFPAAAALPGAVCGPDGRVCARWTSAPIAQALCDAFSGAIVSTSANRSGSPPATSPSDVPSDGVSLCLDGGELRKGPVSTVLDPESGRILREGAVTREQLARISI